MAAKFWTVDQLKELFREERDALLAERTVTDLDTADPELVQWARDQAAHW